MGNLPRAIAALATIVVLAGCTARLGASVTETTVPLIPAPTDQPSVSASATAAASAQAAASFTLYDPTADAHADIDAAVAAAKADGKRVLVDFGADWCPDCHVLATYLEGPAGAALVDASFHVVKVDVGTFDRNLDVSKTLGDPIVNGIPAVVILDGTGAVVGSTGDGGLANARSMSEADVLAVLKRWAP
jgi:thioredoxin 1